ncbi:tellurium resistance protein [Acinetobacter tianfuensis]|uniref:Tellurium resistance protein n=1 Tax=Acinetobacter tianfuensis TaxID=2419603 RepID=A0A3A8E556_9GAMM|nr:tellurium resistance protein [Acinetobacter tianfuensis]RKG29977.1 tellurium resistance protein [Acinetobacter tianfuensis]
MSQAYALAPLHEIEVSTADVLSIKRNDLVPLLNDQYKLNHFADQLVQAQAVLLQGIDPKLTQRLSQNIEELIRQLSVSKKYIRNRKFNALQRWMGIDVEFGAKQIAYYRNLDRLLEQTHSLSQQLQVEIQKSQSRFNQLSGLREQMALHIRAADEFLNEYPSFTQQHPLDHFAERLAKKTHSLRTVQASNDIAIAQMQLSQQLTFSLLDRFKEAQQVLIPAWKYHVQQSQQSASAASLAKLDSSRESLIQTLKKSLENSSKA